MEVCGSPASCDPNPEVVCLGGEVEYEITTEPDGYGSDPIVQCTPADTSEPGVHTATATCGSSEEECDVTVVEVASLLPDSGEEIDDYDSDSNTKTFVLRTTPGTLSVTATPNPNVDEIDLPSGWTLTGGTGSGKLNRTLDTTTKGTHTFTCKAGSSTKTLTIIVVDLTAILSPDDSFSGRSLTRLGIGETGTLSINVDPFVNITDASWVVLSGDASVADGIVETGYLTCGVSSGTLLIQVMILSDPLCGDILNLTLEQTRPISTIFSRDGMTKGHIWNTASAAFEGTYSVAPFDVSFWKAQFREDAAATTGAWGIYENTAGHSEKQWHGISEGNIQTGSKVFGIDRPITLRLPPYDLGGGYSWVIPTRIRTSATGEDGFIVNTVTHSVNTTPTGTVTLNKGSYGVTIEATAPTENANWFFP